MKVPLMPFDASSAIRHIIVKHAKIAGIEAPFLGSHVLRHSNAARQIDLGTRPQVLSDLLGHRNPESISAYVRIATALAARDFTAGAAMTTAVISPNFGTMRGRFSASNAPWATRTAVVSTTSGVSWISSPRTGANKMIYRWTMPSGAGVGGFRAARPSPWPTSSASSPRQFCLYRRRRDPVSFVPDHAFAPVKVSTFIPYIFSHDEIHRILAAASSHHGRFIWASMLQNPTFWFCTAPA